ncbi:MAG TPA: hypothetical protein VKA88_06315 [Solirubrobacterales bacterium]|nr:hypothetical protein [Solirubrobacterales bacterium]
MAALLAAGALVCGLSSSAQAGTRVTVAVLPRETTVAELARVPGLALGVMSAGIGEVPSEQTFLDVSQGNRIDDALYDEELPGLFPFAREVPEWSDVRARADGIPADVVPGLLAQRLQSGDVSAHADQPMTAPAIIAANERGTVAPLLPGGCTDRCLAVLHATVTEVAELSRLLRDRDMLITLASPPPGSNRASPLGIAGRGFDGNLISDSTRTDGYVLSTDLAPTILRRFGLRIPDEMDGEPIRAEGAPDPAAVEDLAGRMSVIPDRRAPVLIVCLGVWVVLALAVNRIVFGLRRVAMAWLALCFAYMPLMLLVGACLEPSAVIEGLLVGLGAAALAACTVRLAWGWRGLAIAVGTTVSAYAIDVIAGSGLTRLSLLGPNPIYGVRFYGIGNELEALLAVMVPVGVGAALCAYSGWGRVVSERAAAASFLGAAVLSAIVFGAGHFGADVGAAITLPVGGAVAAFCLPADLEHLTPNTGVNRTKPRIAAAIVAAALVALVLLALIDVVSGGNSHLTRTLIEAGGASDFADVAERRLELSAHDFSQAASNPLFWVLVGVVGAALAQRRRIDAWLRPAAPVRAGVLGACAAVGVGVFVNDSGATFLVLGACALGASVAYSWSQV